MALDILRDYREQAKQDKPKPSGELNILRDYKQSQGSGGGILPASQFGPNKCGVYVREVLKQTEGWRGNTLSSLDDPKYGTKLEAPSTDAIQPGMVVYLKKDPARYSTNHYALVYRSGDGTLKLNELVTGPDGGFRVRTDRTLDSVAYRLTRAWLPKGTAASKKPANVSTPQPAPRQAATGTTGAFLANLAEQVAQSNAESRAVGDSGVSQAVTDAIGRRVAGGPTHRQMSTTNATIGPATQAKSASELALENELRAEAGQNPVGYENALRMTEPSSFEGVMTGLLAAIPGGQVPAAALAARLAMRSAALGKIARPVAGAALGAAENIAAEALLTAPDFAKDPSAWLEARRQGLVPNAALGAVAGGALSQMAPKPRAKTAPAAVEAPPRVVERMRVGDPLEGVAPGATMREPVKLPGATMREVKPAAKPKAPAIDIVQEMRQAEGNVTPTPTEVKATVEPGPVMKQPWEMTKAEWNALPDAERYTYPGIPSGPNPSHSNYRQWAVMEAVRRGDAVPSSVLNEFDSVWKSQLRHYAEMGGVLDQYPELTPPPTEVKATVEPAKPTAKQLEAQGQTVMGESAPKPLPAISTLDEAKKRLGLSTKDLQDPNNLAVLAQEAGMPLKEVEKALSGKAKLSEKPVVKQKATKAPSETADKLVSRLDAVENAAKERLKARGIKVTTGIDPMDVIDYSIVGAAKIGKGLVKFAEWSADMVATFGEEIRPHLAAIWKRSQKFWREDLQPHVSPVADTPTTKPESGRVASVKNAVTEADRESLGLAQVKGRARESQATREQIARDLIDSGEIDPNDLVSEVNAAPRPLDEAETDVLREHLKRLHRNLTAAREAGQPVEDLVKQFDEATQASKRAGTEQSHAFRARQDVADPYDLEILLQKGRTNRPGFDGEAQKRVVTLHQKLQKTETALEAKESALRGGTTPRKSRVAKAPTDFETASWGQNNTIITSAARNAARERLLAKSSRLHSGIDPTIVADLAIEIGYHVEAGVRFGYRTMRDYLMREFGVDAEHVDAAWKQTMNDKRLEASKLKQLKSIYDTKERIKAGAPAPKTPPIEYDTEWVNLHRESVKLRNQLDAIVEPTKPLSVRIRDAIATGLNMPTGLLASWDDSFVGRQGLKMLGHQPKAWAKGAKESMRAMFSEPVAWTLDTATREHPHFAKAQKAGLEFTELEPTAKLSKAEEQAMYARVLGKIPGLDRITRPFDRAYTTAANTMRHEAFYRMVDAVGDKWDDGQWASYAAFLNKLTGRGDLGRLSGFQAELSGLFISARKVAADAQLLLTPATSAPGARAEAAKTLARYYGALGALAIAANASGVAEVSTDPESADFLKLRIGNTRFDLTGGQATLARAVWRTGEAVFSRSRWGDAQYGDPSASDEALRYLSNKTSPGVQAIRSAWTGKDWKGDKTTGKAVVAELVTPWNVGDVIEAYQTDGAGMGAVAAIGGFWGLSAQSYKESPNSALRAAQAAWENTPGDAEAKRKARQAVVERYGYESYGALKQAVARKRREAKK